MWKKYTWTINDSYAFWRKDTRAIVLGDDSILDISESEFDEKFRWKKISMIFQGAMSSLDPVFTVKDQFVEVLKQHKFQGDFEKTIADAVILLVLMRWS